MQGQKANSSFFVLFCFEATTEVDTHMVRMLTTTIQGMDLTMDIIPLRVVTIMTTIMKIRNKDKDKLTWSFGDSLKSAESVTVKVTKFYITISCQCNVNDRFSHTKETCTR